MRKKSFLIFLFFIFLTPSLVSAHYWDFVTIGQGDSRWCQLTGCAITNLIVDTLTVFNLSVIGDVFNVTMNLVTWNITENFNVGGNLEAKNITVDNIISEAIDASGNITIDTGINANPTLRFRENGLSNGFDIISQHFSTNYLYFMALDQGDGTSTTRMRIRRTKPEIDFFVNTDYQNDWNITNLDCLEFNNKWVCDWDEVTIEANSSAWSRSETNVILTNIDDNVGIGTTTPSEKLTIEGNASVHNITVSGRINQDDYYIAPCDTNNFINGSSLCIWANSTTSLDIPYVNFQPGGAEQASYIAGSFMLVDRNKTNLLNVNRTSCAIEANRSGVELKIDCNSTSPANPLGSGPDFLLFGDGQITGELYLRNIDGQWRFFTRELTLRDELYEDILFNDANLTLVGNKFIITDKLNETLVINIDRTETILTTINDSITLTLGTNTSPAVNEISYQNKDNPTLTRDSTEPTVEHADVAVIYIGDTTNTTYLFDNTISHNEQFIDQVYDTFEDSGAIYLDNLNPSVSTNQINITDGIVRIRLSKLTYTNNVSSDSFFWINSTGNFIQCTDFTCLDKYSSGEEISNNKYYSVVWLVVPVKESEQWLLAIPQNKPGSEHTKAIDAEEDVLKVVFFSSITDFKRAEIPVIRTIHRKTGNNDLIAFPTNDELFQDLRGEIRAGGGSVAPPPIVDHNLLNKLNWSVAAHIIDTFIDMLGNDLLNTRNINASENITVQGNVGIGTTIPQAKLHIFQGNVMLNFSAGYNITDENGNPRLGGNATCTFIFSPDGSTVQEICNV